MEVYGIWYDPQDLTTMYQDAAGTLPVYRPGAGKVDPPVGLMLDKSQGLELGPELWDGTLIPSSGDGVYNAETGVELRQHYWRTTPPIFFRTNTGSKDVLQGHC